MKEHYPAKLVVSGSVLERWVSDEHASWVDHGCPATGHAYPILARYKTRLEVLNDAERNLVLSSAAHNGVAGLWDEDYAYHEAVSRIGGRLL